MKVKIVCALLLAVAGLWLAAPATAAEPKESARAAADRADAPGISLDAKKVDESEAKGTLEEPHFGYVGALGTFEATTKAAGGMEPAAMFVVHSYPDQGRLALGCTKLKYVGAKRLGDVDGWVFATDWDGKAYPSKVFVSAEKVYFGGGVIEYIAADYREGTGWAWKMLPLRRMDLANKVVAEKKIEEK
jgi:hypothetical protein